MSCCSIYAMSTIYFLNINIVRVLLSHYKSSIIFWGLYINNTFRLTFSIHKTSGGRSKHSLISPKNVIRTQDSACTPARIYTVQRLNLVYLYSSRSLYWTLQPCWVHCLLCCIIQSFSFLYVYIFEVWYKVNWGHRPDVLVKANSSFLFIYLFANTGKMKKFSLSSENKQYKIIYTLVQICQIS